MTDYIAFVAYTALSAIALAGIYRYMRDGDNADFMIEQRSDRDAFKENLRKAPIKEKINGLLFT